MRIIVSDSSCLIDLHKGGILRAIFDLPYTYVIPQPLFDDELLSIPKVEKRALISLGLRVEILDGAQVSRAVTYRNDNRSLNINDCFALVLTEDTEDALLFTGDRRLKNLATDNGLEVRGLLWAIDQFMEHSSAHLPKLPPAIDVFINDELVWLPRGELLRRQRQLRKLLKNE